MLANLVIQHSLDKAVIWLLYALEVQPADVGELAFEGEPKLLFQRF